MPEPEENPIISEVPKFSSKDTADELVAMARPEEPVEVRQPEEGAEIQFGEGQKVAVLRSSGDMEYDWVVEGILPDGRIKVHNVEQHSEKDLKPERLAEMQPKFVVGQKVELPNVMLDDLRIVFQAPNGIVILAGKKRNGEDGAMKMSATGLYKRMREAEDPEQK